MTAMIKISVDKHFYIRDPLETKLGQNILTEGIALMQKLGYDQFTFKKLALEMSSTEASVYRYFESKSQFLQYLVCWYWNWLDFLIQYRIHNVKDDKRRLLEAIHVLTQSDEDDPATEFIDEAALHRIIIAESARVYLTRQMNTSIRSDIFKGYGVLVNRISDLIRKVRPKYRFSHQLAMTMITTIHQQMLHQDIGTAYDGKKEKSKNRTPIVQFVESMVFCSLEKK